MNKEGRDKKIPVWSWIDYFRTRQGTHKNKLLTRTAKQISFQLNNWHNVITSDIICTGHPIQYYSETRITCYIEKSGHTSTEYDNIYFSMINFMGKSWQSARFEKARLALHPQARHRTGYPSFWRFIMPSKSTTYYSDTLSGIVVEGVCVFSTNPNICVSVKSTTALI